MKTGNNGTRIIITIVIVMVVAVLLKSQWGGIGATKSIPYNRFLSYIDNNSAEITDVAIQKDDAVMTFRAGASVPNTVSTMLPDAPESRNVLYAKLAKANINHEFKHPLINEFMQSMLTILDRKSVV